MRIRVQQPEVSLGYFRLETHEHTRMSKGTFVTFSQKPADILAYLTCPQSLFSLRKGKLEDPQMGRTLITVCHHVWFRIEQFVYSQSLKY